MSRDSMQSWIERELAIAGVLAAGGGMDLSSGVAALAVGELVLASNNEVWHALAATLQEMHAHGAAVEELLWSFEHAVLCTVQRADGAWLGVFITPKLNDDSALALRAKLDAFKEQRF